MRRKLLFLLALLSSVATLHAQKIEYASTFQEAKKLAAERQNIP
jgi:hypothetical protein